MRKKEKNSHFLLTIKKFPGLVLFFSWSFNVLDSCQITAAAGLTIYCGEEKYLGCYIERRMKCFTEMLCE